ncbi:hypothetical protein HOLleu_07650 [Holothuria leucospilota]|uniref:Uncharacterized protein n=1 Tax=Holothuria leucospilota TaxID=206669 RepID=A0A9Q1CHW2_HOLLE|nr:hypothetical protein HOLleu_07650 [Holothuria leucospilota]
MAASTNKHDWSRRKKKGDDDDKDEDDPVESMIKKTGCLELHYKVQISFQCAMLGVPNSIHATASIGHWNSAVAQNSCTLDDIAHLVHLGMHAKWRCAKKLNGEELRTYMSPCQGNFLISLIAFQQQMISLMASASWTI